MHGTRTAVVGTLPLDVGAGIMIDQVGYGTSRVITVGLACVTELGTILAIRYPFLS